MGLERQVAGGAPASLEQYQEPHEVDTESRDHEDVANDLCGHSVPPGIDARLCELLVNTVARQYSFVRTLDKSQALRANPGERMLATLHGRCTAMGAARGVYE